MKTHTPGTRNRSISDFKYLTNTAPQRQLILTLNRQNGKNNRGTYTSSKRGGGHKRLYRQIDWRRTYYLSYARVIAFEYDPNRTASIALIHRLDGCKQYILKTNNMKIGDRIYTNIYAPIKSGNTLPLKQIPLGTPIHNIELHVGKGGQLVRSAGTVASILAKENKFVTIRLPSGEIRHINHHCWATIGQIGHLDCNQIKLGKAGRVRWQNKRPIVRGSAKNAADHPHGGGEGRAPIGRKHAVTPWGKPTLGYTTRSSKKYSNAWIIRPRR